MRKNSLISCSLTLLVGTSLSAAPLSLVNVQAPDINCVFNTSCSVVVNDTVSYFDVEGAVGTGVLQSRTYTGGIGAPAQGWGAYVYRIDLSGVESTSGSGLIHSLTVDCPWNIASMDYDGSGISNQVWIVTAGGMGSVGPSSAVSTGTNVTFTFNPPIQCGDGFNAGESSYFFGFAGTNSTRNANAQISATVGTNNLSINSTAIGPAF